MSTWPAWPRRCARTRRELPTSTSSIWATGIRSEHRVPTHRRTSSVWWSSRTATTRTISSASTATYLPLLHHVSGRGPVLGLPETFRAVFHLPGTILFTQVHGIGILRSSPFGHSRKFGASFVLCNTYCAEAHTHPSHRSMVHSLRGQLRPREGAG